MRLLQARSYLGLTPNNNDVLRFLLYFFTQRSPFCSNKSIHTITLFLSTILIFSSAVSNSTLQQETFQPPPGLSASPCPFQPLPSLSASPWPFSLSLAISKPCAPLPSPSLLHLQDVFNTLTVPCHPIIISHMASCLPPSQRLVRLFPLFLLKRHLE